MRTRVKICGITRQQDAAYAAEIGVDAIGLVFYEPSPRSVTIEQAKQAIIGLPPFVSVVALFVDANVETVEQTLAALPIDIVQFHGEESPQFCEQFTVPYIKAIRMREGTDLNHLQTEYATASGLLVDSYQAGIAGGTGKTFDWSMIDKVDVPLILAGGLTVDNVTEAIEQTQPYAVDVSGGVEIEKGIKDKLKMQAFMQKVIHG